VLDDAEVRERVARLDDALQQAENIADPQARSTALAAIQGLLELYGEGLARLMAQAARSGGPEVPRALAQDELVAHLLLLHGLHPIDVETRVRRALDEVRPTLAAHKGDVELLGIENGVARLRLRGTCTGCSSSETTLKQLIERAIQAAAPDLEGVETEGGSSAPAAAFVSLECLVPATAQAST
jgi:Fe-S cluster biogenesis protein NfuA